MMAIIACAACGGKVSDKADRCPHCGALPGAHAKATDAARGPTLPVTTSKTATTAVLIASVLFGMAMLFFMFAAFAPVFDCNGFCSKPNVVPSHLTMLCKCRGQGRLTLLGRLFD